MIYLKHIKYYDKYEVTIIGYDSRHLSSIVVLIPIQKYKTLRHKNHKENYGVFFIIQYLHIWTFY